MTELMSEYLQWIWKLEYFSQNLPENHMTSDTAFLQVYNNLQRALKPHESYVNHHDKSYNF